jgi:hypothetical protein
MNSDDVSDVINAVKKVIDYYRRWRAWPRL